VQSAPLGPFETEPVPIVLHPVVHGDERGFFYESYSERAFEAATGTAPRFVQDNHSRSSRGVLRGWHYQTEPHPQGKLVRVIAGAIFDVAVDIRRSSPTFGRWAGIELSEANRTQLWIPVGYAHGFVVISETADVVYKATDFYAPECDRSIRFDDPAIGVELPIDTTPIVSAKDRNAPLLADADVFD
jgi:dTDP-4-dehydrorhamnose 3,5-epimerase